MVIDSGVDLELFAPTGPVAGGERPAFLCLGSLIERKNVVRLADAFATLGRGSLTFVGDGPVRDQLEGRERVRVLGRVPHDDVPGYLKAADVVCAPSLLEPFGQSILEAMAAGKTVVATTIGGPPSSSLPRRGSSSIRSICPHSLARSKRRSPFRCRTTPPASRRRATTSSFRRSGSKRFCFELREIGKPELDQRRDLLLDPGLARELERLLVAFTHLRGRDTLFQAVVPREQRFLDPNTETVVHPAHSIQRECLC